MNVRRFVTVALLGPCALVAACDYDPIDKAGTWRVPPRGLTSNDENLRAMVVNPEDLVRGKGEPNSVGVVAGEAVRRDLTGHRGAVPSATTTEVEGQGGTSQPQSQSQTQPGAVPAREE